jgi:dihydroorotase
MKKVLLYNAEIVNEGIRFNGFVEISDRVIKKVGRGNPGAKIMDSYACGERHDLNGAYLLPGIIDDQVHFREPGLTHKADIRSESQAAVAGGVTSFMDMPNTKPQTITQEAWKEKMALAKEKSLANYSFFIGATNDNIEELEQIDYSNIPGIKVFLGASTGNMLVNKELSLEKIFSLPHLVAIHSEDEDIIRHNSEAIRQKYKGCDVPISEHPNVRSREACIHSTKCAIERAKRHNTRLHILHLSTKEEADMLSAEPLKNKRITGEVCVHHLWFTDNDYKLLGSRIKWNPAIKTIEDRNSLRQALRDGKIDIVATDHAPHLLEEKNGDLFAAASGGPLIQHSLQVMLELALIGEWNIEFVVDKMCHTPAQLFNIHKRGFIREGYYADFAIVEKKPYTVNKDNILTKCGWSPFEGMTFHHTITGTYVNGCLVWHEGKIIEQAAAMPLEFEHNV